MDEFDEGESFTDCCIWAVILTGLMIGIIAVWLAYAVESLINWIKGDE